MSVVLLLVAPDRLSPAAAARAVDLAVEHDAGVHAVYIIDPEAMERVHRAVGRTGFVGEATCEELTASIQAGCEERGRKALADVETKARAGARAYSCAVVTGPFVHHALECIARTQPVQVVVARRPGSKLRRMVRGSDVDALQASVACPVVILEATETIRTNDPEKAERHVD